MSTSGNPALDTAIERAGDGAVVIGVDGHVCGWNRAAEKILGYSAQEVIGRPCCDVLVGYDEHDNRICHRGCHVTTLLAMGEPVQNFDMRSRTKTGNLIWLNISVLSVPNGRAGDVIVHFFRDVTAARELVRLVHERLATTAGRQDAAVDTLTRREIEILRLLATGLRTGDMAERLRVSRSTVKNHVQNVLAKLGVHSRLEAAAYATRHRLL
ncbi:MAG TPA: LuxR C-terminal-related transcriptional regulator [Gemmatimonadales bacterium]|nr:LuxR C-terminal-related transcriptional regulator [Gemmatimonadales bacterium]